MAWGAVYEDVDGLVFSWQNGRPLLPDHVTKQIGKEQTGLGLPRLMLHELRHSHATIAPARRRAGTHRVQTAGAH